MIKVITGCKVKAGQDIQQLLLKLRSHAMTYSGYVGAENLVAAKDASIIAIVKTWDKLEDWKQWEGSAIRLAIMKEIEKALEEEPRITIYRVMPTVGWAYSTRES